MVHREDGSLALDREEYPRPQTTLEGLAALSSRPSPRLRIIRSTTRARHIAISSWKNIPISTSTSCTMPAIPQAWSMKLGHNLAGVAELRQGVWPEAARARVVAMANMGLADPDA